MPRQEPTFWNGNPPSLSQPQFSQGFHHSTPSQVGSDWVQQQWDLQYSPSTDYVPSYASLSSSHTHGFSADMSSRQTDNLWGTAEVGVPYPFSPILTRQQEIWGPLVSQRSLDGRIIDVNTQRSTTCGQGPLPRQEVAKPTHGSRQPFVHVYQPDPFTPPLEMLKPLARVPSPAAFMPSIARSARMTSGQHHPSTRMRMPGREVRNAYTNEPYPPPVPLFNSQRADTVEPSHDRVRHPMAPSPVLSPAPSSVAPASRVSSTPCPSNTTESSRDVPTAPTELATNLGHREVVRHIFPSTSNPAIDSLIHQAYGVSRAFVIRDDDRRKLKTSMARSRSNDMSTLVHNFFYEDSPSPINYGFKRIDGAYSTLPTGQRNKRIDFNRKLAGKLMKDLKFMNDKKGECRNPVLEEIFKFLCSKERLAKLLLTEEISRSGTIPGYIVRYGLVLTWQGIKKLCCGFWDTEIQFKYTDYLADTQGFVEQVVERMESETEQIIRLWVLFHKVQGAYLQSLTLSTLAKQVEGRSTQDESTAKSNKANYPVGIRGVDFNYALPSCPVLSPVVDMHGK